MPQQNDQLQRLEALRRILAGENLDPIAPVASHVPQPGIRPRIGPVPTKKSIFKRAMQGENIQNFDPDKPLLPSADDEFLARVPDAINLFKAVANFTPTPMDEPSIMGGMADAPPLPGLFSRLQQVLKGIPSKNVHPNKLASILQGVPEEAQFTGLTDLASELSQGGRDIPTQRLVQHSEEFPMQLKEKFFGGHQQRLPEGPMELRTDQRFPAGWSRVEQYDQLIFPQAPNHEIGYAQIQDYVHDPSFKELYMDSSGLTGPSRNFSQHQTTEEALDHLHRVRRDLKFELPNPAQFTDYQLPGGSDPWNRVISWEGPWKQSAGYGDIAEEIKFQQQRADAALQNNERTIYNKIMNNIDGLRETMAQEQATKSLPTNPDFPSHAFGVPNTQVWTRGNIRETPHGPFSFIEEIQSDWHQRGNTSGYRDPVKMKELDDFVKSSKYQISDAREVLRRALEGTDYLGFDHPSQAMQAIRSEPDWINMWDVADYPELIAAGNNYRRIAERGQAAADELHKLEQMPPNSPFKQSWPDLALKRELFDAAEKDLAGLAWTPGSVQNRRWSLTQVADQLQWSPDLIGNDNLANAGNLTLFKGGDRQRGLSLNAKDLPNYVGRGIAEQLLTNPGKVLDVGQLEVGKRGMNQFYDKDVPGKLKKILNPMGVQFQIENVGGLPNPSDIPWFFKNDPGEIPIQGVRLTPALKQAILKLKFPML